MTEHHCAVNSHRTPPARDPRPGPPSAGPPSAGPPRISRFFSPLPPPIFALFSLSLGVFSLFFGGVFEGRDPGLCTFGLSGCRVKPRRPLGAKFWAPRLRAPTLGALTFSRSGPPTLPAHSSGLYPSAPPPFERRPSGPPLFLGLGLYVPHFLPCCSFVFSVFFNGFF